MNGLVAIRVFILLFSAGAIFRLYRHWREKKRLDWAAILELFAYSAIFLTGGRDFGPFAGLCWAVFLSSQIWRQYAEKRRINVLGVSMVAVLLLFFLLDRLAK